MNWYKKAQLSNVEMIPYTGDDPDSSYTDIGHEGDGIIDNNYIWVFYDGDILSVKETWETPTHSEIFPNLQLGELYTGRFEEKTDRLSILKPNKGPFQYKEVPEKILSKLYQKFPSVKQIHTF